MPRKTMSIQIDESLQDAFREKCKSEKLKYSEVGERFGRCPEFRRKACVGYFT